LQYYVDAGYCTDGVAWFVGLSFTMESAAKNGWTYRDAVWGPDSGGSTAWPHRTWGRDPTSVNL